MAKSKSSPFSLTTLNFNDARGGDSSHMKVEDVGSPDNFNPLMFCRTCATTDPCLVPIFKGEGLNHQLDKKIQKYLPIKVSQEDDLPVQLCYHCASTLIAWETLIIGCQEAEDKLQALKNAFKKEQSMEVQEEEAEVEMPDTVCDLIPDNVDSDDEPLITKKLPRKATKRKSKTKKQQELAQGTASNRKSLAIDTQELNRLPREPDLSFATYQRHFGVRNRFVVEIFSFRENDLLSCKICTAFREIRSILPKRLACIDCRLDGESENDKNKNFENDFDENSVSSCEVTEKRPVVKSPIKQVICELCGKRLSSKFSLSKHKKIHLTEKTMTCHICGTTFRHRFNLVRHLKFIHEGVREHCCSDCGKVYRSHGELEDHKNVHDSRMKIVCEECGRTFLTRSSFYTHKKYHQFIKSKKDLTKFGCGECGKTFTTKKSRNQHILIHSGEKPIDCKICKKRFRTKANLSQHAKTHSGVKPFACDHCSKSFARKDHLTIHIRCHTGEKPFVCNYCGRGFAQVNDMKKHLKIHEKSFR